MTGAWKLGLAARALAVAVLTVGAITFLFYTVAERFQSWPV